MVWYPYYLTNKLLWSVQIKSVPLLILLKFSTNMFSGFLYGDFSNDGQVLGFYIM